MRKVAPIVAALGLSICISPFPQHEKTTSQNPIGESSFPLTVRSVQDGIGTSGVNDSDEFLQDAIRTRGPERDYSQKTESLLKQMTVKEKVGQMTQLTLEMIVSGHNQSIQIDPVKLQKAIGQDGVGSILNCYDEALTPDKWQEIVTQMNGESNNHFAELLFRDAASSVGTPAS